jgi:hypothetical protein
MFLTLYLAGHGKTMLFLLPVKIYEPQLSTVLIVPLVALQKNLGDRMGADGVTYSQWTSRSRSPTTSVIMVSVEAAATHPFHQWLHEMCSNGRLSRIVVDEAHRAIQDNNYRQVFNELEPIRVATKVPIILLSATVPPSCEEQLMSKFRCQLFETVRLPTNRQNIHFKFKSTSKPQYFAQIASYLFDKLSHHGRGYRAIVFCRKKKEPTDGVDPLAQYLTTYLAAKGFTENVSAYYSDKDDKEEEFARWARGEATIMVATTALGAGIHLQDIRDVVHCGLSSSVVDYAQETGRGGRDGLACNAITFFDPTDSNMPPPIAKDVFGARIMKTVASSKTCRRFHISDLLDGYPTDCVSSGSVLCDNCHVDYSSKKEPPLRPLYVEDLRLKLPAPPAIPSPPRHTPSNLQLSAGHSQTPLIHDRQQPQPSPRSSQRGNRHIQEDSISRLPSRRRSRSPYPLDPKSRDDIRSRSKGKERAQPEHKAHPQHTPVDARHQASTRRHRSPKNKSARRSPYPREQDERNHARQPTRRKAPERHNESPYPREQDEPNYVRQPTHHKAPERHNESPYLREQDEPNYVRQPTHHKARERHNESPYLREQDEPNHVRQPTHRKARDRHNEPVGSTSHQSPPKLYRSFAETDFQYYARVQEEENMNVRRFIHVLCSRSDLCS